MEITVKTGNLLHEPSDLAMLATFEDAALPSEVTDLLEPKDFRGKANETLLLYPRGAAAPRRLLLVGLGKREAVSAESIRRASATAVKEARRLQVAAITVAVNGDLPLDAEVAGQAFAEGLDMGAYRFARYQTGLANEKTFLVERATVFSQTVERTRRGAAAGQTTARGVNLPATWSTVRATP